MSSNTMYHMHHIVPRHAGGTDDPSNLIKLAVDEHADAHKKLYEQHGRWQDKVAWLSLSKQINTDEIRRMLASEANKGPRSGRRLEATIENGKKGNEAWNGCKHTEESKAKISKANKKYWGDLKVRPWQYKATYIVDGLEWVGVRDITKAYNVSRQTVRNRCKSDKFPNWEQVKSYDKH